MPRLNLFAFYPRFSNYTKILGKRRFGGVYIAEGGETGHMGAIGPEILSGLLDEHGAALVLYAQQLCDTPEDAVQEAFLALVRQPKLPDNVVGWLYRVVRNEALNASRTTRRRTKREIEAAEGNEPWFHVSVDDRLDAAEAARALQQLPIEERETIVARLWGGLSFDEIAQLTGTSTSTVHRWYQAGLNALRERLGVVCQAEEKQDDLNAFEAALAALAPRTDRFDRDRLMFLAGRESAIAAGAREKQYARAEAFIDRPLTNWELLKQYLESQGAIL